MQLVYLAKKGAYILHCFLKYMFQAMRRKILIAVCFLMATHVLNILIRKDGTYQALGQIY